MSLDIVNASRLIRQQPMNNVQKGIEILEDVVGSSYPVDYDEVYYNLALGYYRLGDVNKLNDLRLQNHTNSRIARMYYYLNNTDSSDINKSYELITKTSYRKKVSLVRQCGLLLLAGTILTTTSIMLN